MIIVVHEYKVMTFCHENHDIVHRLSYENVFECVPFVKNYMVELYTEPLQYLKHGLI